MQLAEFSKTTRQKINEILTANRLSSLVTLTNPLDINPTADDKVHAEITEILLEDRGVDAVVLSLDPLSPAMKTLDGGISTNFDMESEGSIKNLLVELVKRSSKAVVAVVDGGRRYDPLRDALQEEGVPVFTVCDRAIATLSLYIQGRLAANAIRADQGSGQV